MFSLVTVNRNFSYIVIASCNVHKLYGKYQYSLTYLVFLQPKCDEEGMKEKDSLYENDTENICFAVLSITNYIRLYCFT